MGRMSCSGCAALRRRVAELEATVRDLTARLGQNASNSSVPPSANPPAAPKPVVKEPTGRKPGGQPGHVPYQRVRLPAERVHQVIRHVPKQCARCAQPLPAEAGPSDPPPTWHQVAELPEIAAAVTEHQGHTRTCPGCGHQTHAVIPAAVRAHALGPRLAAAVAFLSGHRHDSKRGVEETVAALFGVPVSVGTVSAIEREVSAALALADATAAARVKSAAAKNVDETSWKVAGKLRWLWAAVTATALCFRIHVHRGRDGLAALLGDDPSGIITSDRWSAYTRIDLYRRQICWAHLRRDFQAMIDRGGGGKSIGHQLLCFGEDLFLWWHRVRDGTLRRATLRTYVDAMRPAFQEVLEDGTVCGCAKTETVCTNLLALEPALWTFTRHADVEPTNNAAERAIRPAVLWRKRSFGCHSEAGCRFVERMLTVVQTLKCQSRPVFAFLAASLAAHRNRQPAPELLPAG